MVSETQDETMETSYSFLQRKQAKEALTKIWF